MMYREYEKIFRYIPSPSLSFLPHSTVRVHDGSGRLVEHWEIIWSETTPEKTGRYKGLCRAKARVRAYEALMRHEHD
ncbi:MAG: hypothetical protein MN733_03305 [Nitrososphaera sp.]|nr:hypothetical protein [Nitrososphaera sp.]